LKGISYEKKNNKSRTQKTANCQDFVSQAWIEKLITRGIAIASVIGFLVGFVLQDVRVTVLATIGTFAAMVLV